MTMKANEGREMRTIDVCGIELSEIPGQGFFCGKTTVTEAQWARVMGTSAPSEKEDADSPHYVHIVDIADCWRFFEKLNATPEALRSGLTFVLPTPDQWTMASNCNKLADAMTAYDCELCTEGLCTVRGVLRGALDLLPFGGCEYDLRVFGVRKSAQPWWSTVGKDLWRLLLESMPEIADKCDRWSEFDLEDWEMLLAWQPQFAAKCDKWADFTGEGWAWLLAGEPQFADRCDWSLLSDADWNRLDQSQPALVAKHKGRKRNV